MMQPSEAETPEADAANVSLTHEPPGESRESGEAHLLLQAFQMFTRASSSLESAFQQLQARAQRLSEELEAKNRELERSLRDNEEVRRFLDTILERLPCGVVALSRAGEVILCNPVASRILEHPRSVCGPSAVAGEGPGGVPVLRDQIAASVTRDGIPSEVEIPHISAGQLRVLATSGTPLNSASGESIGTLHIIRDITEVKALQEQSKRGEKLSAMGEMAVELAHEIRNPLGSIELFASLLEKQMPGGSDAARWAENIRIGSRSLNNIVSNMLHFANPLTPTFDEVEVEAVLEEILTFTDPIMRQRDVTVRTELSSKRRTIRGDCELIKQMILNMILNSMQAMPSRGVLKVSTRDTDRLPGGAACDGIEFRLQDTGVGIAPENLGRIFDPFFTTNRNGTGLGLSVVHQIVERHSGFIHVESELNKGTTFTIILPAAVAISGAA
jgi:signal transduction histidine kinase